LQDLSNEFVVHVDDAINDLNETVPEIQGEIKSLGRIVADELEGALD